MGGGGLGFDPRAGHQAPSPHYITPQGVLAHSIPSLPLFLLTSLPCLELCQQVKGKPLVPDTVVLPDFQPNPPSSAALLEQSPDNVYTLYMCNPSEALHVRCWSSSTSMTTWPCGRLRLSSSTTFVREHSRALGLQRYDTAAIIVTIQRCFYFACHR
jgi:hypothetical protein